MKDPAFLFYSNDFLSGTMLLSDEQVGKYIRLLCLQHQKGHLKEKDMLNICKEYDEDIFLKFEKDEKGLYYNERLDEETRKRKAYSESRRNNRKKKENNSEEITYEKDMKNICITYEKHMENENEDENINKNKINKRNVGESCVDGLQEVIDFYNNNVGVLTPYGLKLIEDYISEMGKDVVIYAMQIGVEADKRTIQYIKAILNNWSKKGIKTLIEAKKESSLGRKKKEDEKIEGINELYEN